MRASVGVMLGNASRLAKSVLAQHLETLSLVGRGEDFTKRPSAWACTATTQGPSVLLP